MTRRKISYIKDHPEKVGETIEVKGWVRTIRDQKKFAFIELNDGSCLGGLQVVVDETLDQYADLLKTITTGCSLAVQGKLVKSQGSGQSLEVHATSLQVLGSCDPETYLLQKKRHSFEFLRTIAHLRPRTNTFGAVTRVRNCLAYATHQFFQERGFLYLHTPIITGSDCEGAGQMFRVTTLDLDHPPRDKEGKIEIAKDFFAQETYLTVSGQLNGEIYACALSDIYTFGPTFRAENSNTSRHLAEFWMIEPEMAFATLYENMDLAESYLKAVFRATLEKCPEDMEFFDKFIAPGTLERLHSIISHPFERITYTEAVEWLMKADQKFEFPVNWGCDLQSEHERYLCEKLFKKPVIVRDYPAAIKSFYMRENEDGKTVAAMDILVPGVGELVGGSQREERLAKLEYKMDKLGLNKEAYWWYLELRKYGSVPHSGFGVGFERLVQFVTGMENIRDVIPFPRFSGYAQF